MAHLQQKMDVFLSHDWPNGIWEHGNKQQLLKKKPFLREDIDSGRLGSPPAMHLLRLMQPRFWFSGHMHVRFEATVPHTPAANQSSTESAAAGSEKTVTSFLALDKVLPGRRVAYHLCSFVMSSMRDVFVCSLLPLFRQYLEILQVPCAPFDPASPSHHSLRFDAEWMAVVARTHSLVRDSHAVVQLPQTIEPATAEVCVVILCVSSCYC